MHSGRPQAVHSNDGVKTVPIRRSEDVFHSVHTRYYND